MTITLLALVLTSPAAGPDVVVVCPREFVEPLRPWVEHRSAQGHRVAIVPGASTAGEIRDLIREHAKEGQLRYVVLVGDAPAVAGPGSTPSPRRVAVPYVEAEVNILWGSEPLIAADNWYADLNDDQIPDVAIGRLTADTPDDLAVIVRKTLAYERSSGFGAWRRRMNFVAGVGGFGMLADLVLESSVRFFLTRQIPAGYAVTMTYGNWRSPFCPDPRLFQNTALQRLSEGCLFWVYLGHGLPQSLDRIAVPDGDFPILSVADAGRMEAAGMPPIALMLACYTGAMDAVEDCLAEEMLRAGGGPVAVLAGSRVTMPYAMAVMASALLNQCVDRKCATLGEAILRAKQAMVKEPEPGDELRPVLDTLASAISPMPRKLAAERAEHLALFNLFGDPLLRLPCPEAVHIEVAGSAKTGDVLKIAGACPVDGRAIVELTVRRDRLAFPPPPRSSYPKSAGDLAHFQEVYQRANDPRLASMESQVQNGRFRAELPVPDEAQGPCHVRVFVEGKDGFALGAADVAVEK